MQIMKALVIGSSFFPKNLAYDILTIIADNDLDIFPSAFCLTSIRDQILTFGSQEVQITRFSSLKNDVELEKIKPDELTGMLSVIIAVLDGKNSTKELEFLSQFDVPIVVCSDSIDMSQVKKINFVSPVIIADKESLMAGDNVVRCFSGAVHSLTSDVYQIAELFDIRSAAWKEVWIWD